MKAADRTLPDWFGLIRRGSLNLPRFQRFEAWEPRRIEALLESVLQDLPAGVALILNVGDKPRFDGRPLAHSTPTEGLITEQLLDGQQRLGVIVFSGARKNGNYLLTPKFRLKNITLLG